MDEVSRRTTLASLGVILLGGCGGGGSPSPTATAPSLPPPPPAPPPPPPPPPPPNIGSFGTLDVTTAAEFAVLGYSMRGSGTGWDWSPNPDTFEPLPAIGMRHEPTNRLLLKVPSYGEGLLVVTSSSAFQGRITDAYFNVLGGNAGLFRPSIGDRFLSFGMQGSFTSAEEKSLKDPYLLAEFAYGIATQPGAAPTSGKAVYAVRPWSNRTFEIDFAARTVTGTIDVYTEKSTIAGVLTDVTFAADGIRFSGKIVTGDATLDGRLDGMLLGPDGREFMARTALPPKATSIASQIVFGIRNAG